MMKPMNWSRFRTGPKILAPENVVKNCKEPLLQNMTTFFGGCGPLATRTLKGVISTFTANGSHRPSPAMWEALKDLAITLEYMANDECDPLYYLSSLDPGVGKTTTIIHFLRSIVSSEEHENVGVLICVSRLDEIRNLVDVAGLDKSDFSILTSDETLNQLGWGHPDCAQVLFTTQQMLESRCENKLFSQAEVFHFHRQPRIVKIWDETILPGQPITCNRDDIASLFQYIRARKPLLTKELEELFERLKDVEDIGTIYIPDFADKHGVNLNGLCDYLEGADPRVKNNVQRLWMLSGKHVTVRKDIQKGNTILDYRELLPEDFSPVVILRRIYEK